MSKYTTQVRFICEQIAINEGYNIDDMTIYQIVQRAAPEIFDFNYPVFDNSYKLPLEIKILKHFYTREICAETYKRWQLFLDTTLNEIMPYYNKLYEAEAIKYNPLYSTDITRTHEAEHSGNEEFEKNVNIETASAGEQNEYKNNEWNTNADTNTVDFDKYSDTPQGGIPNVDPDVGNASYYLTNVRKKTNDTDASSSGNQNDNLQSEFNNTTNEKTDEKTNKGITTTDEYIESIIGRSGGKSPASMMIEYRNSIINIDQMIIKDLEPLFMGIW